MTEKQMNKMGFFKNFGNKYLRWCDAREIEISVNSYDDERAIWNKIFDYIHERGMEDGRTQKSEEIKTALGL